jgi:hypothetical protein
VARRAVRSALRRLNKSPGPALRSCSSRIRAPREAVNGRVHTGRKQRMTASMPASRRSSTGGCTSTVPLETAPLSHGADPDPRAGFLEPLVAVRKSARRAAGLEPAIRQTHRWTKRLSVRGRRGSARVVLPLPWRGSAQRRLRQLLLNEGPGPFTVRASSAAPQNSSRVDRLRSSDCIRARLRAPGRVAPPRNALPFLRRRALPGRAHPYSRCSPELRRRHTSPA